MVSDNIVREVEDYLKKINIMGILDLDDNSLISIVHFLYDDDIYPFIETCKHFNYLVKNYNNIKKQNKNFKKRDLIYVYQPHPYHIVSSIKMIKWAKSHPGFKYGVRHSQFAARRNDFEILKFLYKDNCPIGKDVWVEAVENENIKMIKWCKAKNIKSNYFASSKAAEIGNLKILKLLDKYNVEFDDDACDCAIYGGYINIVDWLIKKRLLQITNESFNIAAKTGNIQMLDYLVYLAMHNLQYGWFNENTCAIAAKTGQLETLKWLRERHCNWDANTTCFAMWRKHKKILKWALENGCPIRENTFQCLGDIGLKFNRSECNIIPNL